VSSGLVQAISVGGAETAMAEAVKMLIVRIATCCDALILPRNGPMGGAYGQNIGSMGAMLMLQQMASQQQMGGGYKGDYGGKGGKGWGAYKGGKGGEWNYGDGWYKGGGKGKGSGPMGGALPSMRSINL